MNHLKNKALMIFMPIVLICLFGCTTHTKVETSQTSEFEKDLRSQYKEIKKIIIQYAPTQIQIIYYMENVKDDTESERIFRQTKALIQSKKFQDEVIQGSYFKKYPQADDWEYPHISVNFDVNNDGEFDFEYSSLNNKQENNQENVQYAVWYYWDYKSTPVPLP
ncbi:hypothetical protein [Paenibacillus sp. N3.4]|uniref:hypothetical protein n=1 Tax=Paenibacillus sp. N3.4 TaxID=2603222 RepID=UPI0011C8AF7B|nr:hypothetical protein [Paenibacillus sp. N3.4]TXK72386.1 hypothetical protein FU659_31340 [Paenibacillus sp. N3.4]